MEFSCIAFSKSDIGGFPPADGAVSSAADFTADGRGDGARGHPGPPSSFPNASNAALVDLSSAIATVGRNAAAAQPNACRRSKILLAFSGVEEEETLLMGASRVVKASTYPKRSNAAIKPLVIMVINNVCTCDGLSKNVGVKCSPPQTVATTLYRWYILIPT